MKKIFKIVSLSTFSVAVLLFLSFMFTDITLTEVTADAANCGEGVWEQYDEPYAPWGTTTCSDGIGTSFTIDVCTTSPTGTGCMAGVCRFPCMAAIPNG